MVLSDLKYCPCSGPGPDSLPSNIFAGLTGVTLAVGLGWILCMVEHVDWALLRRPANWVWAVRSPRRPSVVQSKVAVYFAKRQQVRFRTFIDTGRSYVVPVILVLILASLSAEFQPGGRPDVFADSLMKCAALFFCLVFLVFSACPKLNYTRASDGMFALLYLLPMVPGPLGGTSAIYSLYNTLGFFTLGLLSTICPSTRMAVVLNSIILIWQLAAIFASPGLQAQPVSRCAMVVIPCIYNVCISRTTHSTLWAEAEAQVKSQEAFLTMESLLRVICDAVITLRSDLSLAEPSAGLAILLQQPLGESQPFLELLDGRDQERFVNFVQATSTETAGVIHVDMVSGSGKLPVKIFHTGAADPEATHLLGLVEEMRPVQEQPAQEDTVPSCWADVRNRAQAPAADCVSVGEGSEEHELLLWTTTEEEGLEATLTLRTRLEIEIVEGTASWEKLGFHKVANLEDFVKRFRRSRWICRWLEFMHVMAACGHYEHDRMSPGKVALLDNLEREFRGKLRAVVLRAPPVQEVDGEVYGDWDEPDMEAESVSLQLKLQPAVARPSQAAEAAASAPLTSL